MVGQAGPWRRVVPLDFKQKGRANFLQIFNEVDRRIYKWIVAKNKWQTLWTTWYNIDNQGFLLFHKIIDMKISWLSKHDRVIYVVALYLFS